MRWKKGPPPSDLQGAVILCLLSQPQAEEYYHDPVAVNWWGHKGKSTLGAHYIAADDVEQWCPLVVEKYSGEFGRSTDRSKRR